MGWGCGGSEYFRPEINRTALKNITQKLLLTKTPPTLN